MRTWTLVALVGVTLAQAGARPSIQSAIRRLTDAVAAGDAVAIAAVYAEDAEALPPDREPVTGRTAIQRMWQSAIDAGVTRAEMTTTDVDTKTVIADEKGNYTLKLGDGTVYQHGTYRNVWKNDKGRWMLQRNSWTVGK